MFQGWQIRLRQSSLNCGRTEAGLIALFGDVRQLEAAVVGIGGFGLPRDDETGTGYIESNFLTDINSKLVQLDLGSSGLPASGQTHRD